MQADLKHANVFVLWHPETMLVLVLVVVSYFLLIGPLKSYFQNWSPVPVRQQVAFVLSLLVMYISLGTPIALLGEKYLFSFFMVQTILLMQVMPWLLLLGLPSWLIQPVFKVHWIRRTARFATHPIFSCSIFGLASTVLFIPVVFSLYLRVNWFHLVFQFILLISALLLWWPLFSPIPEYPKLTPGRQLIYLLYASGLTMPINVLLLIAEKPWFSLYGQASRPLFMALLADQQRGGLLMFVGMVFIYGSMGVRALWAFDGNHWGE